MHLTPLSEGGHEIRLPLARGSVGKFDSLRLAFIVNQDIGYDIFDD